MTSESLRSSVIKLLPEFWGLDDTFVSSPEADTSSMLFFVSSMVPLLNPFDTTLLIAWLLPSY